MALHALDTVGYLMTYSMYKLPYSSSSRPTVVGENSACLEYHVPNVDYRVAPVPSTRFSGKISVQRLARGDD